MESIIDTILHLDQFVFELVGQYGTYIYAILFMVIFMESACILTPFLPGDALLFAVGVASSKGDLNVWIILISLSLACIIGYYINYLIGAKLGKAITNNPDRRFFGPENFEKAQGFFDKHGIKAVFLARFFPFIRTFIPFLTGMTFMDFKTFSKYNILGGILWISIFVLLGYFLGNIPWLDPTVLILAVLFITSIPWLYALGKWLLEKGGFISVQK